MLATLTWAQFLPVLGKGYKNDVENVQQASW